MRIITNFFRRKNYIYRESLFRCLKFLNLEYFIRYKTKQSIREGLPGACHVFIYVCAVQIVFIYYIDVI